MGYVGLLESRCFRRPAGGIRPVRPKRVRADHKHAFCVGEGEGWTRAKAFSSRLFGTLSDKRKGEFRQRQKEEKERKRGTVAITTHQRQHPIKCAMAVSKEINTRS